MSGVASQTIVQVDPAESISPPLGDVMVMSGLPPLTRLNVAVTITFALIVTVHVGVVPEQPPDQPTNEEPASGVAVRVTTVPLAKLKPEGLFETVPVPDPDLFMVRVYFVVSALKLADMVWFAVTLLKV